MNIELDEYCPCCGYDTFNKKNRLDYEICPICFWEDDPIQFEEAEYEGGANKISLIQARINFANFGACERGMIKNTRQANKNDKRKK